MTYEPTPGDWIYTSGQIVALHADEDGDHETLIAEVYDGHDWERANGRLLAAARLMLEALEMQEMAEADPEAAERKGYFDHVRALRRAAIARARGA